MFIGGSITGDVLVRVLATGTFDLLHPGHIHYLSEAKKLGDELYVIVARESMIRHKPRPIITDEQRLEMVSSLKIVDNALLGSESDIFDPIMQIMPDIIALGYDQGFDASQLENDLHSRGFDCKVVRIDSSLECSLCGSAKIVKKVLERYQE
ncbi:adenylyltransferase/cytidyltransferase family protein [Methanolobus sediminis]|uniref:FAD synthase n=1 Tax=Methanolobus sediminis TaxID=3072978 RepID=A0AA51UJJ8_9EURY|nr:adenylyltransferase/cytidyltransferase family protein [Methanolobus sediminis]WMW24773.1 adenylyltransferase/cytidyltransferase family protein [Methanolobus sediminis]